MRCVCRSRVHCMPRMSRFSRGTLWNANVVLVVVLLLGFPLSSSFCDGVFLFRDHTGPSTTTRRRGPRRTGPPAGARAAARPPRPVRAHTRSARRDRYPITRSDGAHARRRTVGGSPGDPPASKTGPDAPAAASGPDSPPASLPRVWVCVRRVGGRRLIPYLLSINRRAGPRNGEKPRRATARGAAQARGGLALSRLLARDAGTEHAAHCRDRQRRMLVYRSQHCRSLCTPASPPVGPMPLRAVLSYGTVAWVSAAHFRLDLSETTVDATTGASREARSPTVPRRRLSRTSTRPDRSRGERPAALIAADRC